MLFSDIREKRGNRTIGKILYVASITILFSLLVFLLLRPAQTQPVPQIENYTENEIVKIVTNYFGMSAETAAEVVNAVFDKYGDPQAYIKGEEVSGAIVVGMRFGRGEIVMRDGTTEPVYWRGPSAGFDTGAHASKVFTLVYNVASIDDIYRRFPGVEGSAFFIAGIAVNYQKRGDIVLAPMRTGVGMRLGVNLGYLNYTSKKGFWRF